MNTQRNRLLLILLALLAVAASPLRAQPTPGGTFFSNPQYLGNSGDYEVYYLSYFDTFSFDDSSEEYVYKYSFGWLYNFGGTTDNSDDVYFYDFDTDDYFYTSASLYPYIYSFNLDTYLYYFEGSEPREFYDFSTASYLVYPSVD